MDTQFRYLQLEPQSEFSRVDGNATDFSDENGSALRELGPIGRLNIIVGPNNSGKSRLMRGIDWRQLFLQVGVNYSCRWPPGFIVVSIG